MTATTYPFNEKTEALEVAKAFADEVRGKTILITGGNRKGIFFTTAQAFASQSPSNLIVAGRTPEKCQESIDAMKKDYPDVNYRVLQVDLSSQESVRAAANEALSWADVPKIDIIVNSAGVMCIPERTLTKEGIEMHFATNHIGHWLLSCLLMPKLIKAAEGSRKGATRIINVSAGSAMSSCIRWSDLAFEKLNKDLPEAERPNPMTMQAWGYTGYEDKAYVPLDGYNRSKVANILFGVGANKRLFEKYGIMATGLHPGVIATELSRVMPPETISLLSSMEGKMFHYKTLGAGASTSLVAALDPKLSVPVDTAESENHGAYLMDCQISDNAHPLTVSSAEGEKLWELSEKLVGQKFSW